MKKSIILLFLFLNPVVNVFGQVDVLYEKAFDAYNNFRWKDAMTLLYSYITYKPEPTDFTDKVFKSSVISAYNYARAKYLYSQQLPAPQNSGGLASSVSGLETEPPTLRKPRKKVMLMMLTNTNLTSVEGTWQFKIISSGGTITSAKLEISQDAKIVSGTLVSRSGNQQVIGTFDAGVLIMICLTGLETTQVYTLRRNNLKQFSGTFNNVGRWPDSGKVEMSN